MSWVAWRGDNDIENVVAITPENVRTEILWFEREYAEFLLALVERCGAPVRVLWGVVPQVP
jgi:hypothetical protein